MSENFKIKDFLSERIFVFKECETGNRECNANIAAYIVNIRSSLAG